MNDFKYKKDINIKTIETEFLEGNYRTIIRYGNLNINEIEDFSQKIYMLYFIAKSYEKVYDFPSAAQYYLRMISLKEQEWNTINSGLMPISEVNIAIFLFTGLQLLGNDIYEEALKNFLVLLKYDEEHEAALYYAGICCLHLGRLEDAMNYLMQSFSYYKDYTKLFALGCVAHLSKDYKGALEFYQQALKRNPTFKEVQYNLKLLLSSVNLVKNMQERNLENVYLNSITDGIDIKEYKQIPVFINSRDRLGCLQLLVDWLLKKNYQKIYILDNDSTYQPLLDYYKSLQEKTSITVIFLHQNIGHRALWEAKILDVLDVNTPYIYTDSDVLPLDECPEDFVLYMLKILRQNSTIQKVGLSLRLDDIPSARFPENERQFWELEFSPNLYYAYTDTTFAVYRAGRRFYINEAIRIGYPYMARHLPWYYDLDHLPEDEAYYIKRSNASSTFARNYQKKI